MRILALEKHRLDSALNNMSQGLVMFDAEERIVLCNDLYIKMYGLSREVVKPGYPFVELLRYRAEAGNLLNHDPEEDRDDANNNQ